MIRNGRALIEPKASGFATKSHSPIVDPANEKYKEYGVSWGLGEAGYDIRLKQEVIFNPEDTVHQYRGSPIVVVDGVVSLGRFTIASAMERFSVPNDLVGVVHDKSTWARKGLSVFNTVIEPGWDGYLTLELVYHGSSYLFLPAGCGIAQVLFHEVTCPAQYSGKYQNQEDNPVPARHR